MKHPIHMSNSGYAPADGARLKTAAATSMLQKLLIPVKNGEDARQAVAYAIRRRAEGVQVAVCLLHVEESGPGGDPGVVWHELLEKTRHSRPRPFDIALRLLFGLDIDVAAYVRKGAVAFTILDAAEELDCQEIVMPAPHSGLLPFRWLSRNVVDTLLARQRSVRVVAVNRDGTVLSARQ
ncbi:universal stress protein [Sterolibacterium denitrificans]|nr:universal stress protein [Sterolibacterium denitrificans]